MAFLGRVRLPLDIGIPERPGRCRRVYCLALYRPGRERRRELHLDGECLLLDEVSHTSLAALLIC